MGEVDPRYHENLAWSYSRHLMFNDCRRAYWFEYVATYHAGTDASAKTKLWDLKRLSKKWFLRGSLVHNSISEFISQHSKGRVMAEADLQQHLLQNLERARRQAKQTIAEYHNGLPVENEFFDRLRTDGTEQLSMFLRVLWPPLSRLEYTQHEQSERFTLDSIPVAVRIDLVSKSPDGQIFVVDWKTGWDDDRYEDDVQVGVYGMWAANKFNVDPSKVATDLSYLRTGKTVSKRLTLGELARVRETVSKEYKEFLEAVDRDDNPPNPGPDRCLACKFATVCDAADLSKLRP